MERSGPPSTRKPLLPFATLLDHLTDLELWCLVCIGILLTLHA